MSQPITLNDKYTLKEGRAYMSGIHALVRLPMIQRQRDLANGHNTAGFISGYRGSPLGGYDQELKRAEKLLKEHHIHFEPGLNEDLAATAVWGSQMTSLHPEQAKYDGVFGLWYGKGPGLDRSMDVIKHGNAAGTSPLGGVLAIAGDDHGAKSSTLPHQADHNFMAAFMPELYPASIEEFVEYGLLGIAMSRFSGLWVGLKATAETVETSGTIDFALEQRSIIMPQDFDMPDGGLSIRWPDIWREQDWRLQRYKGFAAQAFARSNAIDKTIWDSPNKKFGIITSGKSYQDVRQALYELGIDAQLAREIGLTLYKVGMPWPLEPQGIREFCEGLDEILVVEEKREMVEHQLRWQLYNWKANVRPSVVGKHDENGQWLLPPENDLDVGMIAHVIAARLSKHYQNKDIQAKLDYFSKRKRAHTGYKPAITRAPYFCSGCPHNSSTKLPEGSRATAGIGCHIMAINMERNNETFTQMGGEGVTWLGQAPFTREKHIFANLGDGTYQHSGSLAIRQAVAANVNITYKILFNDAVAMTGGQEIEGHLTVPQIAAQLKAEGVREIAIASEKPDDYSLTRLPEGVEVHDRRMMMKLQERFRDIEGVTAIIYDQTCAAEKRRRRKRGLMDDPDQRLFINDAVCEGCGDCSVQSNCVSIEPLETSFGRKRQINQSSCNKDYSCVKGFCPSFVSVRGASVRKSKAGQGDLASLGLPELPLPSLPGFDAEFGDYNILVTGIGGTGVLTVGAILGMAAHLDGKVSSVLDMTGLAQKGGSVLSHVRLSAQKQNLSSPRIVTGRAHALLACDSVVAASKDAADLLRADRSAAVINDNLSPVADFVRHKDLDFKEAATQNALEAITLAEKRFRLPAQALATALMGDSIATNLFILGYAFQKGLIPLNIESIEKAIHLNKTAVETNLRTFFWGRMAAHDIESVAKLASGQIKPKEDLHTDLESLIANRKTHLTAYQNAALAARYENLVRQVEKAEKNLPLPQDKIGLLTRAVAFSYAKLLAYKDEYEVARLYAAPAFRKNLEQQFAGKMRLSLHLAPPLLSGMDPATGRPKKREFGAWIFTAFKLLSRMKMLRGTALDIFGMTSERKLERKLIKDYEALIAMILAGLQPEKHALALELARIPETIRGFGPVKMANIEAAKAQKEALLNRWNNGGGQTPDFHKGEAKIAAE